MVQMESEMFVGGPEDEIQIGYFNQDCWLLDNDVSETLFEELPTIPAYPQPYTDSEQNFYSRQPSITVRLYLDSKFHF